MGSCLENNRQAQEALYYRFVEMLKGVCLRYASNEAEAEDILQDAFIQAFKKLDTYSGKGALGGWLRKIAVNKALEQYRKNTSLQNVKEGFISNRWDDDALDDAIEKLELADLLRKIQALPSGYRTVFNLYAVEGFTHVEIAEMLGIAVGTSKSQFSRARQLLANQIVTEEKNDLKRLSYAK